MHDEKHLSNFEDDFGDAVFKEINRPKICHFLYEFLPIIDKHNKQRQGVLGLERKWVIRDCWFRLLATMVGFCVVDMCRWHRHVKSKSDDNDNMRRRRTTGNDMNDLFYVEVDYEIEIKKFSDMICSCLEDAMRKQRAKRIGLANITPTGPDKDDRPKLERIRATNGSTTRNRTDKQRAQDRRVGTAANRNCYVCRKYLKKDNSVNYVQTCFYCSYCKMPLCKESHYDASIGRYFACFEEHMSTDEEHMQCNGNYVVKSPFRKEHMVNLHPQLRRNPSRGRRIQSSRQSQNARQSPRRSPRRSNTTTAMQNPRRTNTATARQSPTRSN